jgi:hypothetical protein
MRMKKVRINVSNNDKGVELPFRCTPSFMMEKHGVA